MNFIYVIHLMCWNYLIGPIDVITDSRNRKNKNYSIQCNNRGRARAPPVVSVPAVVSVVSVSAVWSIRAIR